jgi:hypothetical protein
MSIADMSLKESCRLWNERLSPKPLIKVFLRFTRDAALYSDVPAPAKAHYVPFKLWQPCRLGDLCTKVKLLLLLYYNSISILAMGLLQTLNS